MSRSGYTDGGWESQEEQWAYIRFRGAVNSAIKGKRGQQFLRELLGALDAMPSKRLIAWDLEQDGEHCALGVLGCKRGMDLKSLDPEDSEQVATAFGISDSLAREIVFMNDEGGWWDDTPEGRWLSMRRWISEQISSPQPSVNEETNK
jgi:hypothetical protein